MKSKALIAGALVLLAIAPWAVLADQASSSKVVLSNFRNLPIALNKHPSIAGKDYRLHAVIAQDSAGHPLSDVPAEIIEVYTGALNWNSPRYSKLPPIDSLTADSRAQLQLFYAAGIGWMLVPRGWTVHRAAEGADGSDVYEFTPSTPGMPGWEAYSSAGGCVGCIYSMADGIIPGAHDKLEEIIEDGAKEPKLYPVPDSVTHPTPCMAMFSYRIKPPLIVHAAVFLGHAEEVSETDEEALALYAALPDTNNKLAEFVVAYFQNVNSACSGVD